MRRLLEGGAYFYLSSNDAALIRGRLLFDADARRLLEEIRYFYSQVQLFTKKTKYWRET